VRALIDSRTQYWQEQEQEPMTLPAFEEVEDRMAQMQAPCGAAQAHGLLCGLLAATAESAHDVWLERATGTRDSIEPLDSVYEETLRQIDDPEFGLELLLPPDETSDIVDRTEALAQWCAGFATGFGLAGRSEASLSDEVREYLSDITQVADVAVTSDADDEAALAEVAEYVRMGALLTRTECRGTHNAH
jgi:uncharacterized protein YgfB (UPF0149 family)